MYIIDLIRKNAGKRKIAFWGGWEEKEIVDQIAENKEYIFVSAKPHEYDKKLKVEHLASLNGKSERFYVVVFPKETAEIRGMFSRFGYNDNDVFYVNHVPYIRNGNGIDKYGNMVTGLQKGCKIIFTGYDAVVNIGKGLWVKNELKIHCGSRGIVNIGCNCRINDKCTITAANLTQEKLIECEIGDNIVFNDCELYLYSGKIKIGSDSSFGSNLRMASGYKKEIIIGKDCMFSFDIFLQCGDGHNIYDLDKNICVNDVELLSDDKKKIIIGEHVWCGLRVIILNGTQIGNGSIVGAQSLVKGIFPNNCVLVGSPAKIIQKNKAWSRSPVINENSPTPYEKEFFKKTEGD